jgi:hypothetical protein
MEGVFPVVLFHIYIQRNKSEVIMKTGTMILLVSVTFCINICFTASFSIQGVPRVGFRSFSDTSRFAVKDDQKELERKRERQDFAASLFWVIPWFNAVAAMNSYEYVACQFNDYVEAINSLNWAPGETYGSLIISPVLNGPLSTSIAITFGTLVAVTVSTLVDRQTAIQDAFTDLAEELRSFKILLRGFPSPYRETLRQRIKIATENTFDDLRAGDLSTSTVRKRTTLLTTLNVLTEISTKPDPPRVLDQAFASVQRMLNAKSRLISATQKTFPLWHYFTLGSLAMAISVVFLIEANGDNQIMYQAGFQLRICWSMLFWVFSMLGVLIYDLSTPLTGFFTVSTCMPYSSRLYNPFVNFKHVLTSSRIVYLATGCCNIR